MRPSGHIANVNACLSECLPSLRLLDSNLFSFLTYGLPLCNNRPAFVITHHTLRLSARLLTTEATATLVSAFILSRLDYRNSLLSCCLRYLNLRLQEVQNNAARLILGFLNTSTFPFTLRIGYPLTLVSSKLECICYNCVSTNSPPYLSDLLTFYTAARQLRSCSDNSVLHRPSVRTVSYGQRSFAYSAPFTWNALPQQFCSSNSASTFRSRT